MKWLSVLALFVALAAAENPEGKLIFNCLINAALNLTC